MSLDLCDSEVGVYISSRLKALLPQALALLPLSASKDILSVPKKHQPTSFCVSPSVFYETHDYPHPDILDQDFAGQIDTTMILCSLFSTRLLFIVLLLSTIFSDNPGVMVTSKPLPVPLVEAGTPSSWPVHRRLPLRPNHRFTSRLNPLRLMSRLNPHRLASRLNPHRLASRLNHRRLLSRLNHCLLLTLVRLCTVALRALI
ncbi:hypothetical protein F5880DRAFT_903425 [Lentinula raphanica]|nr:hypothetical protein F5880DRAFT_903425 [Lentinula raphanica]